VVVIGCGKLGAPLIGCLAKAGHQVIGIDVNESLVKNLESGNVTWNEPGLADLLKQNAEKISFQNTYQGAFESAEISFVIVPTPSTQSGEFSNHFVLEAVTQIGAELSKRHRKEHLVVIVSTVMPGSTQGVIKDALLKASSLNSDLVQVCYSPEFIALGTVIKNMEYPDLVLIGQETDSAGKMLEEISLSMVKNEPKVSRLTIPEAEIAKIAINSFVTTKISFSNQISEICESTPDSSAVKVLEAIGNDSRIGRSYLSSGSGYGGPCFPRDNRAFNKYANTLGFTADLSIATDVVNARQNERVIRIVSELVNTGSRILVVGLSYKPDTDVTEESAGLAFVKQAQEAGFFVDAIDEYVKSSPSNRNLNVRKPSELENEDYDVAILFVPSSGYLNIPGKLSTGTKLVDLWGLWGNSAQESYHRLGNYLAK
jgi:UDPglucose 6-dehydrogenase